MHVTRHPRYSFAPLTRIDEVAVSFFSLLSIFNFKQQVRVCRKPFGITGPLIDVCKVPLRFIHSPDEVATLAGVLQHCLQYRRYRTTVYNL